MLEDDYDIGFVVHYTVKFHEGMWRKEEKIMQDEKTRG
jgi:hypothetical protein